MFAKLKQRWRDAPTISTLSLEAERRAVREGQQHPGAEHYLLAALDLPDGSARRVFARLGADPEAYRHALATRHDAALAAMGIGGASPSWADADADAGAAAPAPESLPRGLFDARPSGQALMQSLPALQRRLPAPLCGAHVVLAAARMAHSVAGRAFNTIGIDLQALAGAAEAELRAAALTRPAD